MSDEVNGCTFADLGANSIDGRVTTDDLKLNATCEIVEANGNYNDPGMRAILKEELIIDSHSPGHGYCHCEVAYVSHCSIGLILSSLCPASGNRRSCHYCHIEIEHC